MKQDNLIKDQELLEIIKNEGRLLLPPEGAWVAFMGHDGSKRGMRVPIELRNAGIRHLDTYWAYKEECPWKITRSTIEFLGELDGISDVVLEANGIRDVQLTWVHLCTPSHETVRAWQGEVRVLTQDIIDDMLEQNFLIPVPFDRKTEDPIWDELTRDMVGSLQLDGLSLSQAQDELIGAGESIERRYNLPNHYYIPSGMYKDTFCEEIT